MKQQWISGNSFDLLENGEEFYPRVFEAIGAARKEILLETFILFDDKVGRALHDALSQAARRGVQVDLTIDGWGSPGLEGEFLTTLTEAGVRVHIFDPVPGFLRHINLFRRLHRKLLVIDGTIAFIGGINFSADHLGDFGPEAKQDYSVEVRGPIVEQMHAFALGAVRKQPAPRAPREARRWFRGRHKDAPLQSDGDTGLATFVWRDNHHHRNDIERHYRLAMRLARKRVVIANAYFFPGYAFLKELRHAAKRGVEVSLILQGNPDMPIVQTAASMLYHHLLSNGVHIYEYCDRPLHGKVAIVDDEWATIGSSNLDPLSLSLNLEANIVVRDRSFNNRLAQTLQRLMDESCKKLDIHTLKESSWLRLVRSYVLFHFLRRYPSWIGWLPAHVPKVKSVQREPQRAELRKLDRKTCP